MLIDINIDVETKKWLTFHQKFQSI